MMRRHAAQAAERPQRRPAFVIRLPAGGQQRHADQAIVGQRLFEHRPIARLEDVQRLHHVRKHDQIRQRKQRAPCPKSFPAKMINLRATP